MTHVVVKGGVVLASAATCTWVGVHLLADEGGGSGAVSNLAVIGWALGGTAGPARGAVVGEDRDPQPGHRAGA